LQGLKLRESNILKIIEESLAKLPRHLPVDISVHSLLQDEKVWMDQEQMAAVFFDLERNAVEAMTKGGSLTIMVSGDERDVVVLVNDTGIGIPVENIPLLFTPFFTTKPAGDGTGLGLPTAYATIKAHDGDISLTSNADPEKGPTGTAVRITLPRKQKFQTQETKVILHEEE